MTGDVDLLSLPRATLLGLGEHAVVEVTGLRNPCRQIDDFRPGLLKEVIGRASDAIAVQQAAAPRQTGAGTWSCGASPALAAVQRRKSG